MKYGEALIHTNRQPFAFINQLKWRFLFLPGVAHGPDEGAAICSREQVAPQVKRLVFYPLRQRIPRRPAGAAAVARCGVRGGG